MKINKNNIENFIKTNEKGYYVDNYYKKVRIAVAPKLTKQEVIKEVKIKIKQIDSDIEFGIYEKSRKEKITFEKLFELYARSRQWLPITTKRQRQRFNIYFDELKYKKLANFTNEDLINWVSKIYELRANGQFKEVHGNKLLSMMERMLIIAKNEGYCSNRISLLNIVKFKSISVRSEKLDENFIIEEELQSFCNGLEEIGNITGTKISGPYLSFICNVLYYSGCRIGEARALKVEDIIFGYERTPSGRKSICYFDIYKQIDEENTYHERLKTGYNAGRTMKMKQDIYKKITDYIQRFGLQKGDYLFDYDHSGMPLSRKRLAEIIKMAIKQLKELELLDESFPDDLTPYGFRYSNTLYLKNLGVSVENAASMQGHTVSVMLDIYARIDKLESSRIFSF